MKTQNQNLQTFFFSVLLYLPEEAKYLNRQACSNSGDPDQTSLFGMGI